MLNNNTTDYEKLILTLWICLGSFSYGYSQSSDEKIADAMNNSDWFALDSLYQTEPKDSISDFFEIFSRCLIGNRLNRPDVSIPAFTELFNTQSESLDFGNMLNSSMMFAMDLSRIGDNKTAAKCYLQLLTQYALILTAQPLLVFSNLSINTKLYLNTIHIKSHLKIRQELFHLRLFLLARKE